ncbi:MAG: hypothetical protein RLZZ371_63, partial [Pseudomonadota bacterium]
TSAPFKGFQTRPQASAGQFRVADVFHPASGDCSQCHGSFSNFNISSAPAGHIPYAATATCESCHVNFGTAPTVTAIHANIQSKSTNCAQCHDVTNAASYAATTTLRPIVTPAVNHIPMGGLPCETCHVGVGRGISSTPVTDSARFNNAAFSHSGMATGCSSCHGRNVDSGTFDGVFPKTISSLTPEHIPVSNNVGCEVCHTNSVPAMLIPATGATGSMTTFAGAKFSHNLLTGDCETCHGPASTGKPYFGIGLNDIVRLPSSAGPGSSSHIPTDVGTASCADCHIGSLPAGLLPGVWNGTMPTKFRLPAPASAVIHKGVSGNCASCHESGLGWMGMELYPRSPNTLTTNAQYTGFNARPISGGSGYAFNDTGHPSAGDCSQCHGGFTYFGAPTPPSNHIPFNASASCTSCHNPWGQHPSIANIHANIPSTTSNCAQCHSKDNAAMYSTASRTIVAPATNHVPMRNLACEVCHVGAGMISTPVTAVNFSGAKFSHSGITANCAECHGSSVTTFQGITNIVKMPDTSPATSGAAHIPSSQVCENCHLGSVPSVLVAANATTGRGFLTPAPTSAQIHAGVSTCSSCHEKDNLWLSMDQYGMQTAPKFTGFHTRPYANPTTQFAVNDAVHPAGGDCASCHTGFTEWQAQVKPSNHIPTNAASACNSCHTTSNYSTMPTLANIHANAPSTTGSCAQCHSAANATQYNTAAMTIKAPDANHIPMASLDCVSCHVGANSSMANTPVGNGALFTNSAFSHSGATQSCSYCHGSDVTSSKFQGGIVPKGKLGLGKDHIPTTLECDACHLSPLTGLSRLGNTPYTFANGQFSHTGISDGCASCHGSGVSASSFYGINSIVVLPPSASPGTDSHIPSPINSQCEVCHLANMPTGLVGANASSMATGTTKFFSPAPSGSAIHTNITNNCNACHESTKSWMGMSKYPRNPTSLVAGASYTGFHTRPINGGGTYSINDAAHPTTGDCSQCHGSTINFTVAGKPSNHIPTAATAACTACHTNISATDKDFSVKPSVTNIHANAPSTSSNCAQCHSATNAAAFANPTIGFAITAPAANHVPFGTTACEVCHVGANTSLQLPVTTGKHFSGSKYSHQGITTGCDNCHGESITNASFQGITSIVVVPPSSTPGASSHIPYGKLACEVCHAATVPSGLVAVTGSRSVPGSLFKTPAPTSAMVHTGISNNCQACHEKGYVWMGVDQYPISPTTVTANASYRGFQTRPYASATTFSVADSGHEASGLGVGTDCSSCHSGTSAFTGEGKPAGHMPTPAAVACTVCHVTAGDYSVQGLGTVSALHTGITAGLVKYTAATIGLRSCTNCHAAGQGGTSGTAPFAGCDTKANCSAPPPITYQPKTVAGVASHVPIGTLGCNACHAATSPTFGGVNMKSGTSASTMHSNAALAGIQCQSCHEYGMSWTNVTNLLTRIPSKHTTTARKAPNDCSGCHSFNGGFRAAVRPIMRAALIGTEGMRLRPNVQATKPVTAGRGTTFDHQGVAVGSCKSCHEGRRASGMPARHLMVLTSCDTCHRTTAWTPARFTHNGIQANICLACHNGMGASARPAGHFMDRRSCDSCHQIDAWRPVRYSHLSPAYRPSADLTTCVSCHVTNSETIPRQMRSLNRVKPIQVGG